MLTVGLLCRCKPSTNGSSMPMLLMGQTPAPLPTKFITAQFRLQFHGEVPPTIRKRNNKDQALLNIPRPFGGSRVNSQTKSGRPIQQHFTNPANPLLVKELHYDVPTKHNPMVLFLCIGKCIHILNQLCTTGIDRLTKKLQLFNCLQSLGNRGSCLSLRQRRGYLKIQKKNSNMPLKCTRGGCPGSHNYLIP